MNQHLITRCQKTDASVLNLGNSKVFLRPFDSTSFDSETIFNNLYRCPKNGIADTSKCTYDSPTGISQPHFLNADPSYLHEIQGLFPEKEKHSFFLDVHPVRRNFSYWKYWILWQLLGITGKINVGIQINVRIRKDNQVDFLKNMTRDDFWFPVIWFSAVSSSIQGY